MAMSENKQKMLKGELFRAFTTELTRERQRCLHACHRYNAAGEVSRRRLVELWRDIDGDKRPMPPKLRDEHEDEALFEDDPWVEPPVHIDYGTNVRLGSNVYLNFNSTFIDTCLISIGSRTLVGPNVSFYSGTHPLNPAIRNGTKGPEMGKEIHVGDDCWIGGGVTILPGIHIGRGATVGAGSVVTKDVLPFTVVAGNPARLIKHVQTSMDATEKEDSETVESKDTRVGAEEPLADFSSSVKI